MRRIFTKKSSLPIFLAFAAIIFALPQATHAWSVFGTLVDVGVDSISHLMAITYEIFVLPLASAVLALSGLVMDAAIQFSLHTAYIFSLSPAINLGWSIVRDIANIFFIFILIYISLGTIVSGLRFGTMTLLKNVVIAAMLINFSLFFTKAIVDMSNIFGNWLYSGIEATLVANTSSNATQGLFSSSKTASLSDLISARLGIMQWWRFDTTGSNATQNASAPSNTNSPGAALANEWTDPSKGFIGVMLRLAVVLIATYIFVYASILFISRSVTILFLLVFSPIGFMGSVLPQIKTYSKEWWEELSNAGTFPVAFLLMLYISIQFINSLGVLNIGNLTDGALNPSSGVASSALGGVSISQYFQYFLVIFLLKSSLSVAKKYGGALGKSLGGFAESIGKLAVSAAGTYATGGAMMALRAGGRGLGAAWSAESGKGMEAFKKTALENVHPTVAGLFTGEGKLSKYIRQPGGYKEAYKDAREGIQNKMKSGTWDVRNVSVGGETAGAALTSTVASGTGAKIELKGKEAKDIKAEQAEWAEEKKIEKANTAILKDIDGVLKDKANFYGLGKAKDAVSAMQAEYDKKKDALAADPGNAQKQAEYDAVKARFEPLQLDYKNALANFNNDDQVKAAKGRISDQTQKLGNKEINMLDKKILKSEAFVQTISQSHAEAIADKAESDEDKAKVWSGRLSDVASAVQSKSSPEDVGKALKNHSDKELENLPANVLKDEALVNPHAMDYDKFDKLMKSSRLTSSTKADMKKARYKVLDEKVAANDIAGIAAEMKELEENEIAKLGWKEPGPNQPDKRLSHPEVVYRLTPRTLGKILDELGSAERAEIKRKVLAAPANQPQDVAENLTKVQDWFVTNPIGKTF